MYTNAKRNILQRVLPPNREHSFCACNLKVQNYNMELPFRLDKNTSVKNI